MFAKTYYTTTTHKGERPPRLDPRLLAYVTLALVALAASR